jgi:hypothetical protein
MEYLIHYGIQLCKSKNFARTFMRKNLRQYHSTLNDSKDSSHNSSVAGYKTTNDLICSIPLCIYKI